jgi:hypothetical protein
MGVRRSSVVVSFVLLLIAAPARADEVAVVESTPPPTGAHLLLAQVGLTSPIGLAGVSWGVALHDRLRLELGLGAGFTGAQVSVMPIVGLGSGAGRWIAGAGASWSSDCCVWLNAEIGYEKTSPSGFTWFLAGGASMPTRSYGRMFGGTAFVPMPAVRFGLGSWIGDPPSVTRRAAPDPALRRRHRLSVQAGLQDAPLGILGVAWAVAPWDWFRIEAGVGTDGGRPLVGLSPGLALGTGRTRLLAGVGASVGLEPDEYCSGRCVLLGIDGAGVEHIFGRISVFGVGGITFYPNRTYPDGTPRRGSEAHARLGVGLWL